MAFDQGIDLETSFKVWRIRMFELGHSFEDLDNMALNDIGDIIGYWSEKGRAEERLNRMRKNLKGR